MDSEQVAIILYAICGLVSAKALSTEHNAKDRDGWSHERRIRRWGKILSVAVYGPIVIAILLVRMAIRDAMKKVPRLRLVAEYCLLLGVLGFAWCSITKPGMSATQHVVGLAVFLAALPYIERATG